MEDIIKKKLKDKGKDIFIETLSCADVNTINKIIEDKGKERKKVPFVLFFNK